MGPEKKKKNKPCPKKKALLVGKAFEFFFPLFGKKALKSFSCLSLDNGGNNFKKLTWAPPKKNFLWAIKLGGLPSW